MSSFKQIYYQIVLVTKYRGRTIAEASCEDLYKYIAGIIKNKNCKLYCINGVEDHIHIFCDLHPSIALADFIKNIKVASSIWMKASGKFPDFIGWQVGYGAFTYSIRQRDIIINYVNKQKQHHRKEGSHEEYKRLLAENGVEFDERYTV